MHVLGLSNYSLCFLRFSRKLTYSKHTEKNKRGRKDRQRQRKRNMDTEKERGYRLRRVVVYRKIKVASSL